MSTAAPRSSYRAPADELALLRALITEHAAIERLPGSAGEAESARRIHERLLAAGARSEVQPARFLSGWAPILAADLGTVAATGIAGGWLGRTWRRRLAGAGLSLTAGYLLADDVANRRRLLRRALRRERPTQNVVAEVGDPAAPIGLVVLAHHDAARTGVMFDQRLQQAIHRRFPERVESTKSSLPFWWLGLAGPLLVAAGHLTGRRAPRWLGTAASALGTYWMADISRNPPVPGANDNLSAVGLIVALAERLREHPLDGMRVLLVSAGAEEELQGGIYDVIDRYGEQLHRHGAQVLCVDTIGSSRLILLEGEGTMRMHDYDAALCDRVAAIADEAGVELPRGYRARVSTDAIVPVRAGLPTTGLVSLEPWGALANYHLPTDDAEHLNYETVSGAVEIAERLARQLAQERATDAPPA